MISGKLMNKLKKYMTMTNMIIFVAVIVLILGFRQFSMRKFNISDKMTNALSPSSYESEVADSSVPVASNGNEDEFTEVEGVSSLPTGSMAAATTNPEDLLPKDQNNEWSKLNPTGTGDLNNVNLLKAGYHCGVDTVSNSLRNANLQIRSEPPNPTDSVSPWLNTTIEPDLNRVPLELGSCPV